MTVDWHTVCSSGLHSVCLSVLLLLVSVCAHCLYTCSAHTVCLSAFCVYICLWLSVYILYTSLLRLSVCLSLCLVVHLTVCLSVSLLATSDCLSLFSVCICVFGSVSIYCTCTSLLRLSVSLLTASVCLSVSLLAASDYLSLCFCVCADPRPGILHDHVLPSSESGDVLCLEPHRAMYHPPDNQRQQNHPLEPTDISHRPILTFSPRNFLLSVSCISIFFCTRFSAEAPRFWNIPVIPVTFTVTPISLQEEKHHNQLSDRRWRQDAVLCEKCSICDGKHTF